MLGGLECLHCAAAFWKINGWEIGFICVMVFHQQGWGWDGGEIHEVEIPCTNDRSFRDLWDGIDVRGVCMSSVVPLMKLISAVSGLIVTSALMIWKSLMLVTGSESPVVVVLSGSMEPGFYRGDILFLHLGNAPIRAGEIVVYNIDGRDIPIVHRALQIHEKEPDGAIDILTKVQDCSVWYLLLIYICRMEVASRM